MKKSLICILTLIVLVLLSAESSSSEKINSINQNRTSAVVIDTTTGKVISSINPDMMLNPASLTKIPTAYTALKILGASHRIPTLTCSDSKPLDGHIDKLYLIGQGDPLLVEEEYWRLTGEIKARGVKSVRNIIVDDSFFDGGGFPTQNKIEDSDRAFATETSAVSLNYNSLAITVTPDGFVSTNPDLPDIKVTYEPNPKQALNVRCETNKLPQSCNLIGKKPLKTTRFYRRLADPALTSGLLLADFLKKRGIIVNGKITKGDRPNKCEHLAGIESKPLSEILKLMMTYSNNFIAEQMVKYIGAVKYGPPGTTHKGIRAIKEELSKIGIKGEVIENGSGLSNNNRFSAMQLALIMKNAWQDFSIRPEFEASLARNDDVNGTLDNWGFPEHLRTVRGKTGTLGVSSAIAGFLPDKIFVLITNNPPKGPLVARNGLVKLLLSMLEEK